MVMVTAAFRDWLIAEAYKMHGSKPVPNGWAEGIDEALATMVQRSEREESAAWQRAREGADEWGARFEAESFRVPVEPVPPLGRFDGSRMRVFDSRVVLSRSGWAELPEGWGTLPDPED